MIIELIIKVALLLALLSGCASQPQSPPWPATATKPVAAKKQPEMQPEAKASGIESTGKPTINPPVKTKNQSLAGPIRKPTASAAAKVASHPDRINELTVAKQPLTKKQPGKAKIAETPASQGSNEALQMDMLKEVPAQPSPPEIKKTPTVDLKAKVPADAGSGDKTGKKTQLTSITKHPDDAPLDMELSSWIFDEQHLPKNLPGGWVLDIRPDQLGSDRRCLLYSDRKPIFDGYDKSWIRLQITTDAVVVNTDSNLDTSYPGQGLRVDNGELIPFNAALLNKKTTYTQKAHPAAMVNGRECTISLGFWPTWPVTKTQQVSIDLTSFKRAYAALKACSAAQ